jgi:hypothetical protein
MGKEENGWQDRGYVLSWFGESTKRAVEAYRRFVEEGIPLGRRPELVGGGLIRSAGGWSQVQSRRKTDEGMLSDERILGGGPFVGAVLEDAEERIRHQLPVSRRFGEARRWTREACEDGGVSEEELRSGSRRGLVSGLRRHLVLRFIHELGLPQADASRLLGVTTTGIAKILARDRAK